MIFKFDRRLKLRKLIFLLEVLESSMPSSCSQSFGNAFREHLLVHCDGIAFEEVSRSSEC